jgi:hypothetical protein
MVALSNNAWHPNETKHAIKRRNVFGEMARNIPILFAWTLYLWSAGPNRGGAPLR